MPIQLTITGNHATDLLAEITQLAEVISFGTQPESQMDLPFEPDVKTGMARATELDETAAENLKRSVEAQEETKQEQSEAEPQDFSEVDAMGLEWDERIHSSNKKKTSKGVWTRRRGIQDSDFNRIVAELKGEPVEEEIVTNEAPDNPLPPENSIPASNVVETTEEPQTGVVVDLDSIRALMTKKGRPEGKDDPQILASIRKIIIGATPEGIEPKISNIPQEKLVTVYKQLEAL